MSDYQTDGVSLEDIDTLQDRTVKELRYLAQEQGLSSVSGLRKQELINRITQSVRDKARARGKLEDSGKRSNNNNHNRRGSNSHQENKGKKKSVHEILPESDAPTLDERLAEIEPQLGPYLIQEGTLEILPDGYGFLRSVNYNYKASPDDIYVSPSQIKRFRLKQGDCVIGIIRPPKVGERYFALLRVDGVNGKIPHDMDNREDFEDLLPIYPEDRF